FKKGQRVVTVRGTGRIRQGYDSGEMIGYEIDGADGSLFAAEESDLRPAPDRGWARGARGRTRACTGPAHPLRAPAGPPSDVVLRDATPSVFHQRHVG